MEIISNEFAKWATISVFHPTISANESKYTIIVEQTQRTFYKRDINVGTVVDRLVPTAIFRHQHSRNHFLPDIRRISYDVGECVAERGEEKIALDEPRVEKLLHLRHR